MNCRCHELCKYNIKYPDADVTRKILKLWDVKGFVWCKNCDILLNRDKYIHEVRCRCCNGKLKLVPRNRRRRRGPRFIDYASRFCLECGSNTTYIANVRGKLRPRWYRFLDGWSCYGCHHKRHYAIKKLEKAEELLIKIKMK
jgi:hypothetical protein